MRIFIDGFFDYLESIKRTPIILTNAQKCCVIAHIASKLSPTSYIRYKEVISDSFANYFAKEYKELQLHLHLDHPRQLSPASLFEDELYQAQKRPGHFDQVALALLNPSSSVK
jgi:hypothetical protein